MSSRIIGLRVETPTTSPQQKKMSFIVLAPKSDLHWERDLYNVMGEIKNRPSFSLPFYETREEAEKEYPDVDIFELPLTDGERLKLRNHVLGFIKETIII